MTMGPVQMLVIGFEGNRFTGDIAPELDRLRENDLIRLIDMLFVIKDEAGNIDAIQVSDLSKEEATEFGALIGALVGLGAGGEEEMKIAAVRGAEELEDGHVIDEDEIWYAADALPAGSSAAIALIEHRWAIPLRDAIVAAGGVALADEWVHPADLVAIGAEKAAERA